MVTEKSPTYGDLEPGTKVEETELHIFGPNAGKMTTSTWTVGQKFTRPRRIRDVTGGVSSWVEVEQERVTLTRGSKTRSMPADSPVLGEVKA